MTGAEAEGPAPGRVSSPAQIVQGAYAAFNRGDFESAIALMCEDVNWHDTWTGRRRYGRSAVRNYWNQLTRSLIPRVEVLRLTAGGRSEVSVEAHLLIYDPAGKLLAEQDVCHVFKLRDNLITRMNASVPRGPSGNGRGEPRRAGPTWRGGHESQAGVRTVSAEWVESSLSRPSSGPGE